MMYSDYFNLSTCAFSMMFIPFFVIAQFYFAHLLQGKGFDSKNYLRWVWRNFMLVFFPLIGICVVLITAELALYAFIYNSLFYDMDLIIAYSVATLLIVLAETIILVKYVRTIKLETQTTPTVCSKRCINIFLLSSLVLCAVITLVNVFNQAIRMVYFLPLAVPLIVPLVNWILYGRRSKSAET